MEDIMEHFGQGFLGILGAAAMLGIYIQFLTNGNFIYEVVYQFLGVIGG